MFEFLKKKKPPTITVEEPKQLVLEVQVNGSTNTEVSKYHAEHKFEKYLLTTYPTLRWDKQMYGTRTYVLATSDIAIQTKLYDISTDILISSKTVWYTLSYLKNRNLI